MPVPIAELFVSVGADVSGAMSGLNNLSNGLKRTGQTISGAGRSLTAGLTAPILGISTAVFAAGSDFEHAFTQVRRTVDNIDETPVTGLRDSILAMSKVPAGGLKTASELANIAAIGGQLGLSNDEIKTYTSLVARLSLATDLPFEEIASDVGVSLKVMKIGEKDYERFGATVAALGNQMGGTERDIFEFSRRLGGTLSSVGVKPDQILAISAALSEVGINPEMGATAINQFFVEMTNALNDTSGASEEAKQKMQSLKDTIADLSGNLQVAEARQKEFGRNTPKSVVLANQVAIDKYKRELGQANVQMDKLSSTTSEGKLSLAGMANITGQSEDEFRNLIKTDPARAFAAFVTGLQDIRRKGGPEAVTKALEDMGITGDRQRQVLLNLAQSENSLGKALDVGAKGWEEQTALTTEVGNAMKDLQNQIKLSMNTLQTEMIGAFDKNRDSLQKLLDKINDEFIPALENMASKVPTLSEDQLKFFAILAGLGPALIIVGGIASGLTALANPVGVVIALIIGIGIAIDQIANHWEDVKTVMENVPILRPIAAAIQLVKDHGEEIKTALNNIITTVGDWGKQLGEKFAIAFNVVGQLLGAFATAVDTFFKTQILPIFERFGAFVAEKLLGAFITILQTLQSLGITTLPGVGDVGTKIGELQSAQQTAAAQAGGQPAAAQNVTVAINNPVVFDQAMLESMNNQALQAFTDALISAERATDAPPDTRLPGQPFLVPGA